MLSARNITAKYGRRTVLHDVSLTARPGALTAIIGPNGSGKTTCLKALTGELEHSGVVALGGRDCTTMQPWELATLRAVLPQASTLAFPFTVIEVVRMGLRSGAEALDDTIPLAALDRVGLAGYANRFFQELSGGEAQRVHLARVLSQVWHPVVEAEPRWMFLDEPVSSLDIGHQLDVMRVARAFADQGGGVVAIIHDLNLTAMFADHVILFSKGRILASGPPETVIAEELLAEVYEIDETVRRMLSLAFELRSAPGGPGTHKSDKPPQSASAISA